MKLSRKQFLLLGAGTTAAVASVPLGLWVREIALDRAVPDDVVARISEFFRTNPGAVQLGRAYGKEYPDGAGPRRLARRIFEKMQATAGTTPATDADLTAALLAAHRADWDVTEPVLVSGWALSETEALLCALAATVQG